MERTCCATTQTPMTMNWNEVEIREAKNNFQQHVSYLPGKASQTGIRQLKNKLFTDEIAIIAKAHTNQK